MPKKLSHAKTERSYRKIVIGFIILTAVVVVLIVYFSFSKTVITVTAKTEKVSTDVIVTIKETKDAAALTSANTILGSFRDTTVEGSKVVSDIPASSSVEGKATGTITVINQSDHSQPLIATTRFLSIDGILFRSTKTITVPAGSRVDVTVTADKPGASGNVAPGHFTIPGLWTGLQTKIYGESKEAMTGGVLEAKVVTQELITKATDELKQQLEQEATTKLTQEYPRVEDQTLQTSQTELLETKVDAAAGATADQFTVNEKYRITGIYFNPDNLQAIILERLKEVLTYDKKLVSYDKNNLAYTITNYDVPAKTAVVKVHFASEVVIKLTSDIFNRSHIVNKDRQEIQAYFTAFDSIESVKINFSPFWVVRAPALEDHIEIRLETTQ